MQDGEGAGELFAFQGLRKPVREAQAEPAGLDVRHEPLPVRLEPPIGRMDGDRPVLPADAEPGEPAAGAGAFELDAPGDRHRDAEGFDRAARSGLEQGAQHRALVRAAFRRRERDDVLDTRELRVDDQRALAALARRRPLRPGAGDRPGSVGRGDGEVAQGERPALRMTLDRERSAHLVESPPAPLVHDPRREGVDRSLRLDEPAVLPRAPCLAGHDAGDLLRPREQAAEAKAGEIDVAGGDVCGAGPRRGGGIPAQVRREVDPAAPGGLERTGDAVPVAGALEMQGHAVERQRRQAALLVDPHDARREQRDLRLALHPLHETAAPPRPGRRGTLELPDRERSVGPPYDGERRAADGDVARLQGPRPEQIERIDREPEIGDADGTIRRCARRGPVRIRRGPIRLRRSPVRLRPDPVRIRPGPVRIHRCVRSGLVAGEPHVLDPKHRRPATPLDVDHADLDLPVGDAAEPFLDLRAMAPELGQEHPQPRERHGAEQRHPGERVGAPAQQRSAEPVRTARRPHVAGVHDPPEMGAGRYAPPPRPRFRAPGPMLRPRLISRRAGRPGSLAGVASSAAPVHGGPRGRRARKPVTSARRHTVRASTGSPPAA